MNRKIKFRAWYDGAMYTNHSVCIEIGGTVVFLYPNGEWKENNELVLMQWTGLAVNVREDGFNEKGMYKTSIPLYEGDIVQFDGVTAFYTGNELKGEMYVVCYQAELGCGFVLKHISVFTTQQGGNHIVNGKRTIDSYTMSNLINHYRIIGNIYESPELLPHTGLPINLN